MAKTERPLPGLLDKLRWVIPVLIAALGIGCTLLEHLLITPHPFTSAHVVREAIITGTIGPTLAWLLLSWATRVAQSRQQAEEALERRNQELVALNAVGEAASSSLDLDEVLQTALHRLVEVLDLEAAELRTLEGAKLVLKSHHGVSSQFIADEAILPLDHCLCGQCAVQGAPLRVGDLNEPGVPPAQPCVREGFRSVLAVPMKARDQVVGVIHLASRDSHVFTPHDEQLLSAIGHQIAVAIENTRRYAEAQRRAVHLTTVSLVGQQVTALLDLDSLLSQVVTLIREKFGYYHTHIFLVDEEAGELVLKEASGPGAELIKARGLRLKIGQEGITGWVAHTGQALLCNDVSREPHYYAEDLVPKTRAELAIPLRVGKRIIGVLDVQSDRCDAFDEEDLTTLQVLGNQVAIAIENARLFQETRQRYEAMIALHETSLDMISQLDMAELLKALLRRGVRLWDALAGNLFLYDATQELIYNVASYNTPWDWTGVTLRPGEGLIGQVILTGRPLIVNDYENWPGKIEAFTGTHLTAAMGAPLRWRDQVIGGVVILHETKARHFDHNDLWLLSLFADLATIAIKNAELHTQVKEFGQELEQKIEERTRELARAKEEITAKAEQLRSLLAKTIHIQQEERARIARDMHDSVVQLITAARYELQAAKVAIRSGSEATAQEKLNATRELLNEMEMEIRRAIYDLHPPVLDAVGLIPALEKYASGFQELSGVACHLQVVGVPCRLPPPTEVAAFRMVEEALHNVAAHARAESASVVLDFQPTMLCVTVQDDGQGFDYHQWAESRDGKHLGLAGMQERVESLGGKMEVWSKPEHGTRVMFLLPVEPDGG